MISKVWDTYTGTCLHTFSHNHIVRAVAIDAKGTQALTGGHEKKLRLFDLTKTDQEASFLSEKSLNGLAHDGNIKSVVWQRGEGEDTVVSAGEDKTIKWWDLRSMSKTNELTFDEPITSMERSTGSLGELLTVTSGKKVYFLDLHK